MLPLTLFSLLLCSLSLWLCIFCVYVYLMSCVPPKLIHLSAHPVLESVEVTINTKCIQYDITVTNWNHQNGLESHKIVIWGWMFLLTQESLYMKLPFSQEEMNDVAGYLNIQKQNKCKEMILTFFISLEGILVFKSRKGASFETFLNNIRSMCSCRQGQTHKQPFNNSTSHQGLICLLHAQNEHSWGSWIINNL